jgi:hypothetical protein
MADLVIVIDNHGYSDNDPIYVSWLDGLYYVGDSTTNYFKLTTASGGTSYVTYTSEVTDGYVRQVDDTSGVKTISGLDHLEGKSVYVVSNGSVVGEYVVSSGRVTVPDFVFSYQVGIGYKMKIRTMRLSVPQESGTIQSRIKRISETVVRYIRSLGGSAGQEYDSTEYLTDLSTTFSTSSKDDTKLTRGGFTEDAYTVITSDDPLPFTALATIISFEVEERR